MDANWSWQDKKAIIAALGRWMIGLGWRVQTIEEGRIEEWSLEDGDMETVFHVDTKSGDELQEDEALNRFLTHAGLMKLPRQAEMTRREAMASAAACASTDVFVELLSWPPAPGDAAIINEVAKTLIGCGVDPGRWSPPADKVHVWMQKGIFERLRVWSTRYEQPTPVCAPSALGKAGEFRMCLDGLTACIDTVEGEEPAQTAKRLLAAWEELAVERKRCKQLQNSTTK